MSGMVTNGPMPHIWLMLMAVAWKRPMRRTKPPSVRDMSTSVGWVKLRSFT